MRKSFKLDGLCCANCAQKIEDGIGKINGVNSAKIMFMSEKLVMDFDQDQMEQILDQAQKVCTKYEDDCIIIR